MVNSQNYPIDYIEIQLALPLKHLSFVMKTFLVRYQTLVKNFFLLRRFRIRRLVLKKLPKRIPDWMHVKTRTPQLLIKLCLFNAIKQTAS